MTLEASLGERHSTDKQRRVKKWKVSVSQFVILRNVSSLFWPRLEPANENSFYQRRVTFLSSAARITSEDATIRVPRPSGTTAVMTGDIWWQERAKCADYQKRNDVAVPTGIGHFKLFRHDASSFSAICEDRP